MAAHLGEQRGTRNWQRKLGSTISSLPQPPRHTPQCVSEVAGSDSARGSASGLPQLLPAAAAKAPAAGEPGWERGPREGSWKGSAAGEATTRKVWERELKQAVGAPAGPAPALPPRTCRSATRCPRAASVAASAERLQLGPALVGELMGLSQLLFVLLL